MIVSTILAEKGRDVVTIEPNATLAEAAKLLAEKRIGAALVLGADRRISGIISERDIVRALAVRGAAALDEPVSRSMTRRVETCNQSEPICNLMERMTAGKFRHLPVVDQGRLVGIVSIGDAVKHRLQEMERETLHFHEEDSTWYYAIGCILGELSGQLFPATGEEYARWEAEDRRVLAEEQARCQQRETDLVPDFVEKVS